MLRSTSLKNLLLNNDGYAHILSGVNAGAGSGHGKLYIYAGTDPADADAALNTTTTHTLLGVVTSDAGVGTNNLSFAAAAGGVLAKASAETWSTGAMVFTGHSSGSPSLTATFARFVEGADDPTVADPGTGHPRLHLTIRQLGEVSGDINLTSSTFVAGTVFVCDGFQIQAV